MESRASDTVAALAVVAGGCALVFVHYYGGSPGDPEGWFAAVGFASPFIGAGFLALVGTRRDRPALVFATGVALIPMSVLSIVLMPLLLPAAMFIFHAVADQFDPRDLMLPALLALGLATALAVLVFHQDPVTWSTPEGSGGSSNIVTATEAVTSIATTVVVGSIASLGSMEPRHRQPA